VSADLEHWYSRLPVPLQHAGCSVVGLHTQWTRYGGSFRRMLAEAAGRGSWSQEQMVSFRDRRLRAFVDHAFRTAPFYRRSFAEAGIEPVNIATLDDLEGLPILTRGQVQEHGPELVSTDAPTRGRQVIHTSGSTGAGLRFATLNAALQEQRAVWWRYRSWHGIREGAWCGFFMGRSVVPAGQRKPPFWRYNLPGRQIYFSAYHMSPATLGAYVNELRKRRPPWLHGFPSLLSLVAHFLIDNGLDLGYPVRWVTTGAENLLPQQAAVIERAFGVRPRQHYGMAEAIANISECERGKLHVDEDFAAVEFLPIGDKRFRVVGTNFTNPVTPLIRYDVLDVVTIDGDPGCDCGHPGRVVTGIDGRQEDHLVLDDGSRLTTLNNVFMDMTTIREAQFRQDRAGEFTLVVVRGPDYGESDESRLEREVVKRVGDRARFKIDYAESLSRTKTGKLRLVVSHVGGGSPA
jgi:phenylacetate-CoA ligase